MQQLSVIFGSSHPAGTTRLLVNAILALLLVLFPLRAAAQDHSSVSQIVTVEVKPIIKIAVTGSPRPLVISDVTRGARTLSVSDNSTRYSMVTNLDDMKIVASISDPMPEGTRLFISLESTTGNTNGSVDLSQAQTPVNLVTGISRGCDLDQTITYTFTADQSVFSVDRQSRSITLTLTN